MQEVSWDLMRKLVALNEARNVLKSKEVQPIPEYDEQLNGLPHNLPQSQNEYAETELAQNKDCVANMGKDQEEYCVKFATRKTFLQIQECFPGDDLCLNDNEYYLCKSQKFKGLVEQHRLTPTVINSNAFNSSNTSTDKSLAGFSQLSSLASEAGYCYCNNREFVSEVAVTLTSGVQSQERYLFLFSDLLLVAKPNKSCSSFKLKARLRVSELWLSTCIDVVSEVSGPEEKSFVLGWPTTNYVITFSNIAMKELWQNLLSKHINMEKEKEEPKKIPIKIQNKVTGSSKLLDITNTQTTDQVLSLCLNEFGIISTRLKEYQLWVMSGKDNTFYPLIGHELPFSIVLNNLRDAAASDMCVLSTDLKMDTVADEFLCKFVLKKAQNTSNKRLKSKRKSPLKLVFRRGRTELLDTTPSPAGQLFGLPLSQLCCDNYLPKPVSDMLRHLYQNGPFTTGVFRKSGNARICRELKEKLDAGIKCSIDAYSTYVVAATMKDFLRNIPCFVLNYDIYDNWMNTVNMPDGKEKIEAVRKCVDQLPIENVQLLQHLFCVLHFINEHSHENSMTAYNLAICIAPSMLNPVSTSNPMLQAQASKMVPKLVQHMIEEARLIFGVEIFGLFGNKSLMKPEDRRLVWSGDSESLRGGHDINGSSMDSLDKYFIQENFRTRHRKNSALLSPSSLSHDSGLALSDSQLYPDSDTTDTTTDSGVEAHEKYGSYSSSSSSIQIRPPLQHSTSASQLYPHKFDCESKHPVALDLSNSIKNKEKQPRNKSSRYLMFQSENDLIPPPNFEKLQNQQNGSNSNKSTPKATLFSISGLQSRMGSAAFSESFPSPKHTRQSSSQLQSQVTNTDVQSALAVSNRGKTYKSEHKSSYNALSGSKNCSDHNQSTPNHVHRVYSSDQTTKFFPAHAKHFVATRLQQTGGENDNSCKIKPPTIMRSQSETAVLSAKVNCRINDKSLIETTPGLCKNELQRSHLPTYCEAMSRKQLFEQTMEPNDHALLITINKKSEHLLTHQNDDLWSNRNPRCVTGKQMSSKLQPSSGKRSEKQIYPLPAMLNYSEEKFSMHYEDGILYHESDSESSESETISSEDLRLTMADTSWDRKLQIMHVDQTNSNPVIKDVDEEIKSSLQRSYSDCDKANKDHRGSVINKMITNTDNTSKNYDSTEVVSSLFYGQNQGIKNCFQVSSPNFSAIQKSSKLNNNRLSAKISTHSGLSPQKKCFPDIPVSQNLKRTNYIDRIYVTTDVKKDPLQTWQTQQQASTDSSSCMDNFSNFDLNTEESYV